MVNIEESSWAIPPLVQQAMKTAEERGFSLSCSPETGRLLQVLAAQVRSGVIGEIGTGCGVGAAWMISSLRESVVFVTVEVDEEQAQAVLALLADRPRVRVISGDWREILAHGPFTLLFVDAAAAKRGDPEAVLGGMEPGGLIVMDDLTPGGIVGPDPVREFWLHDPRVVGAEILVRPSEAVILAARKG